MTELEFPPTPERLNKIKDALHEQASTLPEMSMLGTDNDLDGMRLLVKYIDYVVSIFDNKELLQQTFDANANVMANTSNDKMYDRLARKEEVLYYALGKGDCLFRDEVGDDNA